MAFCILKVSCATKAEDWPCMASAGAVFGLRAVRSQCPLSVPSWLAQLELACCGSSCAWASNPHFCATFASPLAQELIGRCLAKRLNQIVRILPQERSLTTTQRDAGKESTGARAYETQTAVNEYLHFHYGPQSVQLEMAMQGALRATWGFQRVLDVCVTCAKGWEHALDVGCAVGGNTFSLSSRFEHVVGVDTSHAFIQTACSLQRSGSLPYLVPGRGAPLLNQSVGVCW